MGRGEGTPIEPARLRAEKPWICPALHLDDASLDAIEAWTASQQWPEGTELQPRNKLHVTAFYAREGLANAELQQWLAELRPPAFSIGVEALELFDPGDHDSAVPVVMKLDAPELAGWALRLAERAERTFGIEPVRHPDGYQPHITIAKAPGAFELPPAPRLHLHSGELTELHSAKLRPGICGGCGAHFPVGTCPRCGGTVFDPAELQPVPRP